MKDVSSLISSLIPAVPADLFRPGPLWDCLECSETPLTADLPQEAAPVYHCGEKHRAIFNPPTLHPSTHPSVMLGINVLTLTHMTRLPHGWRDVDESTALQREDDECRQQQCRDGRESDEEEEAWNPMKNLDCPGVNGHKERKDTDLQSSGSQLFLPWPRLEEKKVATIVTAHGSVTVSIFSVWNHIYHRSCSGSYNPPCCCTGCRCHDNLHRWMTGRCQCLGRRRTWGRRRGRDRRRASADSVLWTTTLQLHCCH